MTSIAVVGAGGVGGLLGAMLARNGCDLRVLARGAALAAIRERGLRVRGPDGDHATSIAWASDDASALGVVAVVLVAVKAWQLSEIGPRLSALVGDRTLVVPLQNGVEASERLAASLGEEHVAGGLCHMLSQVEQPGVIRWVGAAPAVTISTLRPGQTERVEACAAALRSAGVRVDVTDAIAPALWSKLLFVAPFGAVGASERAPAGVLRRRPASRERLEAAMREVFVVAGARGVALPADAVALAMQRMDSLPDDATSSMQRDLVAGRPSELHELIGAVVRLGREARVATPVSAALYAELTPLEQRARA